MHDDQMRAFAMSGLLLQEEIANVERDHQVPLRPKRSVGPRRDEFYYRQFEDKLRAEAAEMSEHYALFYCLERTIRVFIMDILRSSAGEDWWEKLVPEDVRKEAEKNMQREQDSAITPRSDNPIDYTTFGQLSEIIRANWTLFGGVFESQKAVERVMMYLNILRGPIAHCSPLAPDEVVRLRLTMRDWFRLVSAGATS